MEDDQHAPRIHRRSIVGRAAGRRRSETAVARWMSGYGSVVSVLSCPVLGGSSSDPQLSGGAWWDGYGGVSSGELSYAVPDRDGRDQVDR